MTQGSLSKPRRETESFPFVDGTRPALGITYRHFSGHRGPIPGGETAGGEADHSQYFSDAVKKAWPYFFDRSHHVVLHNTMK